MSIKNNSLANFAGQVYATLISIILLPYYLEFLGAEAYGLVGFFVLLESWLSLLTAGLAPALARQVAYFRGNEQLGERPFRVMLRSFELIVLLLGCTIALAIWATSGWISTHWLTVRGLAVADVIHCITLMGCMVGMRWGIALYVSGINGLELQIWLNGFNCVFATMRYGLAYLLLRWVSQDVTDFFKFQLVISILELLLIAHKFYASQPPAAKLHDLGLTFSWAAISPVLPFALGITYTSMLWIFTTQSDKLILSHVLPLDKYGYLALVAIIANAVLRFSEPINQAVLPRLTIMHSRGDNTAMYDLYRTVTQYLSIIAFSVAGILAIFAEPVLFALTGNELAAKWGAPVLFWFALGNAVLVIAGMQYLLQFAHGQLRLHVINTSISTIIQVPILAYFAYYHGPVAVAMTWFCIRLTTFFVWPAIVHHKFAPGLHWKWLLNDVLTPLLVSASGLFVIKLLMNSAPQLLNLDSRVKLLIVLAGSGFALLALNIVINQFLRSKFFMIIESRFIKAKI